METLALQARTVTLLAEELTPDQLRRLAAEKVPALIDGTDSEDERTYWRTFAHAMAEFATRREAEEEGR